MKGIRELKYLRTSVAKWFGCQTQMRECERIHIEVRPLQCLELRTGSNGEGGNAWTGSEMCEWSNY